MFITASTEGTGSWRNLITNLASELKISLEADKPEQKYASFFSKHFQCNKVSNKIKAFLEGSSIKTFMNLYKEWQSRDKIRAFKARYDKTYAVSLTISQGFVKCIGWTLISKRALQIASVHLVKGRLEIQKVVLELVTKTILLETQNFIRYI